MSKKPFRLTADLLLRALENQFGDLPPKLFADENGLNEAIGELHSRAFLAGHELGLTEGKHGARALESYGKASSKDGSKLSKTEHRDVEDLVDMQKMPDPLAGRRRTRSR